MTCRSKCAQQLTLVSSVAQVSEAMAFHSWRNQNASERSRDGVSQSSRALGRATDLRIRFHRPPKGRLCIVGHLVRFVKNDELS